MTKLRFFKLPEKQSWEEGKCEVEVVGGMSGVWGTQHPFHPEHLCFYSFDTFSLVKEGGHCEEKQTTLLVQSPPVSTEIPGALGMLFRGHSQFVLVPGAHAGLLNLRP